MKRFFKENWKFLLVVLLAGLIGGYFLGVYSYESLSTSQLKELEEQNITKGIIIISTIIQYAILYGLILACFGIVLSKKINLWKEFKISRKAIIDTGIITIVCTLVLYPIDKLVFGSLNNWVNAYYTIKPTISEIIGGILIGGVIEEVMMRLFFMSLFVFIVSKLFYINKKEIPTIVFVIANVVSALLFASGHLPSTAVYTTLSPVIIIRCFLFNGGLGLAFGYLYRKYNIGYAMIAHGISHLLADILMIIFI